MTWIKNQKTLNIGGTNPWFTENHAAPNDSWVFSAGNATVYHEATSASQTRYSQYCQQLFDMELPRKIICRFRRKDKVGSDATKLWLRLATFTDNGGGSYTYNTSSDWLFVATGIPYETWTEIELHPTTTPLTDGFYFATEITFANSGDAVRVEVDYVLVYPPCSSVVNSLTIPDAEPYAFKPGICSTVADALGSGALVSEDETVTTFDTFSKVHLAGVEKICFEQIANYNDELNLQFSYTYGTELWLKVYNYETDALLDSILINEWETNIYQIDTFFNWDNNITIYVELEIQDSDGYAWYSIARSEPISIKSGHDPSVLISYSNDEDFANLNYDGSPGYTPKTRIPALFWRTQIPQQKNVFRKSNGERVTLLQRVNKSKIFETDWMPDYMHVMLSLIFAHDNISIDGTNYVSEEDYEFELTERFGLAKGKINLIDQTYEKENIF